MSGKHAYTLLELNQYIRRVISLNFDQPLWIECEIGQASLSRGNWYLDLIQKEDEVIAAQCQALLWSNVYFFLKRKSPIPPEEILKQGIAVKLKVNVDYHERYGLKLVIEDIDTSFTIGVLEMQRQAILLEIKKRDLVRKNAQTHLSSVVQRVAIISSDRAAGWKDFVKHIHDNPYGYDIRLDLFESAMQGQQVEVEILHCLKEIEKKKEKYDAVAIIRGGGGRTDLAAFDNLALAIRIAEFSLPVFIGIGHEIDQSVLDLVAFQSFKTPTAVADFIIEYNATFESKLDELASQLREEIEFRIREENETLTRISHDLRVAIKSRIAIEQQKLEHTKWVLFQGGRHLIQLHQNKMDHLEAMLQVMDPDKVLERGYTITSHQGKTITNAAVVVKGMEIQTTFHDGSIKSTVG